MDHNNRNKRQCRENGAPSIIHEHFSYRSRPFVHGNEVVNREAKSAEKETFHSAHNCSPSARQPPQLQPSSIHSRASQVTRRHESRSANHSGIKPWNNKNTEEDYLVPAEIPPPRNIEENDKLWEQVRKMVKTYRTMTSTECRESIFAHRGIRICENIEPQNIDMWSDLQQKASEELGFQLRDSVNQKKIKELAGPNVYCKEVTEKETTSLDLQIKHLEDERPGVEPEWSSSMWEAFIFRTTDAPDANRPIENQHAAMRFLKDRTQRIIFSEEGKKVDSRYPPIVSLQARPSVPFSEEPWEYYRGKHGGRSGYAYCDISYRVSILDWINTLTTDDQTRLHRLPLMRLYPSSTKYLPSLLMCEVKASPNLIDMAKNYLALQAATMQHERLKLCWLGRSTDAEGRLPEHMKKPSYFVVHLLALVGPEAHHYICRLRPIAVENLAQGQETPVTYEMVFQGVYKLKEEFGPTTLFITLNKVFAVNNTIGRDAQLAELKAALISKCMDIPHQGQTFAWKCEADEAVLVIRTLQKYKPDLLEEPDLEADVVGLIANEATGTADPNASTSDGPCIVFVNEDQRDPNKEIQKETKRPAVATLSPRRNRSGFVRSTS
ncbi:hypothetical protein MMC17_009743 [Xylographa soralifera]|nr:hypothetical protein [Xylographa soralifera]